VNSSTSGEGGETRKRQTTLKLRTIWLHACLRRLGWIWSDSCSELFHHWSDPCLLIGIFSDNFNFQTSNVKSQLCSYTVSGASIIDCRCKGTLFGVLKTRQSNLQSCQYRCTLLLASTPVVISQRSVTWTVQHRSFPVFLMQTAGMKLLWITPIFE
jgi:hypothetical protein